MGAAQTEPNPIELKQTSALLPNNKRAERKRITEPKQEAVSGGEETRTTNQKS